MGEVYKTITITKDERILVGVICDVCGKEIFQLTPYYEITTGHYDWGNDSGDSRDKFIACSPECVMKFAEPYLINRHKKRNTSYIEIQHENGYRMHDIV